MSIFEQTEKNIEVLKGTLDTLPKGTPKEIQKYNAYVGELLEKYNTDIKYFEKEIKKRYNIIANVKASEQLNLIELETGKFNLHFLLDQYKEPLENLGFDKILYDLNHFYKESLNDINRLILKSIEIFNSAQINYKFDYSEYVIEYIDTLKNNPNKIANVFENIYWKCPDIITHIELNMRSIYLKNKRKLHSYYLDEKKKYLKTGRSLEKYFDILNKTDDFKNTDEYNIICMFKDDIFQVKDFNENNIKILTEKYTNNISNVINLYEALKEYKNFLKYKYFVDDVKERYKNKEKSKGLLISKLKEIKSNETKLWKLNINLNHLKNKKVFKNPEKDNLKKDDLTLKINHLILDLKKQYTELDKLRTNEFIGTKLNDASSIYEALLLAYSIYNYSINLIKKHNKEISMENIEKELKCLSDYLFYNHTTILNNIKLIDDKDIALIICDKYKLLDIEVDYESLNEDSIDNLIKELYILIMNNNIEKSSLKLEDIDFYCKTNKVMNEKK